MNLDITGVCARCIRKDGDTTIKFFSKENCLDPGPKADLPELTQVEEMLIARVHPFMEVRQVRGAQYKYTGHVVNFLRETARVYAKCHFSQMT